MSVFNDKHAKCLPNAGMVVWELITDSIMLQSLAEQFHTIDGHGKKLSFISIGKELAVRI